MNTEDLKTLMANCRDHPCFIDFGQEEIYVNDIVCWEGKGKHRKNIIDKIWPDSSKGWLIAEAIKEGQDESR